MELRPDERAALANSEDQKTADALSRLSLLLDVAHNDSDLDGVEVDAVHDTAPAEVATVVQLLNTARLRGTAAGERAAPAGATPAKPGRNDPCHCGSGKKFKRCCG